MFKIVKHELKRQLKTKGTLIILGITLILTALLGYYPASSRGVDTIQPDGSIMSLRGIQAIKYLHELEKGIVGEVTPEKMLEALDNYKDVYEKYDGQLTYTIHATELRLYSPITSLLTFGFPDMDAALEKGLRTHDLTTQDVMAFYENRASNQNAFFTESRLSEAVLKNVQNMESRVNKPFYYASNAGWDTAVEYVGLITMMIAFLATVIAAQVFSNSYRSGEDEILRCTKYGRKQFAKAKVLATLILVAGLYVVCILVLLGVNCATLGADGLQTSIQFMDVLSPVPLTYGGMWLWSAVFGFVAILATVSSVLFFSSKFKASIFVMALSLPLIILPMLMRFALNVSSFMLILVSDILPSSGLTILYSVIGGSGGLRHYGSVWSPYVIIIAAAIEIIVLCLLTVRAYKKHEAI